MSLDWFTHTLLDAIKPDPTLTVSEWADEYRVLSSVASAEAGRWRTSRTPYLREIMDCLSANSKYEKIVFIKGAQVGGTECGNNWIGYIIDKVPGPTMLVQPTGDMAKDNSKTRIDPLIEETPTLRAKVREARAKDSGNAMLMKEFPGGFLGMTGANSPATLRSKPIKNLFLDEVDSYPGDIGGEGDPTQLAIVRTRTFSRRKILMVSTPTIYGRSRIQAAYNDSDMRRFHVPCPHCSKFQALEWERIKFDANKPDTAHYVCNGCGEKIYNHEKEFMLLRGKWIAENPNSKIAGFHISSLYSPVGWYSWANAAQDFINAKHDVKLLKVFVNTVLGECWEEKGDAPEWEKLYFRREKYERNIIPMRGLFLTAGVDIQKDRIECEIVAWGRGKESWSIDYRVFPGDTSNPTNEPFKRLDQLLNESFQHESGVNLQIRGLCVDTGYNAQVVYNWVRKYPISRVQAIKGQDSIAAMVGIAKPVDIVETGSNRKIYRGVKVFSLGVGIIKSELYAWLKQTPPEPNQSYPAGYCHYPESYEEEYFKQLTAETLVQRGRRFEWKKGRERNEALDCRVYARAAAAILGIDRFNDNHWEQIESMILNTKQSSPPPPAPRKKQLSSGITL